MSEQKKYPASDNGRPFKKHRIEHWQLISVFLVLFDIAAIAASYFFALLLRFDMRYNTIPSQFLERYMKSILIYIGISLIIFLLFKLYRSIWRFASYAELYRILAATGITVGIYVLMMLLLFGRMPILYFVFGGFCQMILTLGVRFSYPVIGSIDALNAYAEECYAICSVGMAKTRKSILERITNPKIRFATLIDPDARIYKGAFVGEGSIICGGSILAIGVQVGKHVLVNLNCTLGHDSVYEDYSVVNPGVNISGNVQIKRCCDLGTGAKVIQEVSIGPNTVIGAGAAVIRDIPADCLAVGVPARVKK